MWQALRLSERTSPDFVNSARELGQRTSAKLILTVGVAYLIWHMAAGLAWPGGVGWRVWLVSPVMLAASALAWVLLSRRYLLAQIVWQLGLLAAIALSAILFEEPRIIFLYAMLPLTAVITIGWPAAAAVEGLMGAAMLALARAGFLPLEARDLALILAAGAFGGLLGWAASDSLLTVVYWSLSSYTQARDMTEEAQQNRGQLARVLKDLDQAYYRLQRANAALVAAWRAAAEAERFKAEFATNISHELRTPLNLIVGFSEMMMTAPESYGNTALPGPYRRDLNAIYTSAQHLLALVDDVIDLARIDAGRIALSRDEVDVAQLVREATDMVRDYVSAKGLYLQVRVAEPLPALWIDRLRIRQVLLNLLVNAARFTEKGGITVDVACLEGEIVARVTDTGRGIPSAELPRIFEEFRPQEDSGESPWAWHSGSGLGLPISKRFVELHHGRMGVESVFMEGTTIWFALPASTYTSMSTLTYTSTSTYTSTGMRAAPRHSADERIVVAVDEDASLARFLQRHLDGYRVVGACSAAEGLELIEELKPVAVLMDSHADPAALSLGGVPVIHCPLPSNLRAAQALGARAMLSKPVSRDELLAAIDGLGRPVRRVLIADDDPEMARMFERMLSSRLSPRDILEAHTGPEVLSLLQAERPDLLLLDLVMPEVSGQEVLRRMAADPVLADIAVIVITAQAQDAVTTQLQGEMRISRADSFRLGEIILLLEAVCGALAPGWS